MKQVEFVRRLAQVEHTRSRNGITVYIDEVHFYADADLRKLWAYKGQPTLVLSSSPGRKKVSLYGATAPALADFFLWEVDTFNGPHTAQFLHQVRARYPRRRIDLVFDGGPQHQGPIVEEAFGMTRMHPQKLPGYSPELNAIEPLWRWFREEVTYNYCHANTQFLRQDLLETERAFNKRPAEIQKRLQPDLSKILHLLNP